MLLFVRYLLTITSIHDIFLQDFQKIIEQKIQNFQIFLNNYFHRTTWIVLSVETSNHQLHYFVLPVSKGLTS